MVPRCGHDNVELLAEDFSKGSVTIDTRSKHESPALDDPARTVPGWFAPAYWSDACGGRPRRTPTH